MLEPVFKEIKVLPVGHENQNLIDGKCTWFYETGEIKEVANFTMGTLDGENVVYNRDGSIKEYAYYSLNLKVY